MSDRLDPLLRLTEVLAASSTSRSLFYRMRERGETPNPDGFIHHGRTPVWRESTVADWIATLIKQESSPAPTISAAERSRRASLGVSRRKAQADALATGSEKSEAAA